MTDVIELHDSVIQSLSNIGPDIHLRLSPAILHRSAGIPSVDKGHVFTVDVIVKLQDGDMSNSLGGCPVLLADGKLIMGREHHENSIPIPLRFVGNIELSLQDARGSSGIIRASAISVEAISSEVYLEAFPGSENTDQ